jgi:hypothetical protein
MDTNITNKTEAFEFLQKKALSTEVIPASAVEMVKPFFAEAQVRRMNLKPPIIVNSCFCRKHKEIQSPTE